MTDWKANRDKTGQKKRSRKHHRVASHRAPVGSGPGTFVVPPGSPVPRIRATRYTAESSEEREVRDPKELASFCARGGVLWVDVQGLGDRAALEWIAAEFELHPLVLADIAHVPQRPKCELYGETTFFVARRLAWKGELGDLVDERQITLVLGKDFVLTFHEREDAVFDPVRARLARGAGEIRKSGADHLAYALLDVLVDEYLPIMDRFGELLESLEERVVTDPGRGLLRDLAALRGDLLSMRRDLWPMREALHEVLRVDAVAIGDAVRVYLRDVHDHCVQVAELLEVYREVSSGLQNIYLTSIANRTNEVMKVLTVVSTIFIPLTFLVGVWGMNFEHMPELHEHWAYPAVWAVMLVIGGGLWIYFWRRGWIGRDPE